MSLSIVKLAALPSMITVTSVWWGASRATARGARSRVGAVAANSSMRICSLAIPAACSERETPCIMSSGPQIKATSMALMSIHWRRNCVHLSSVMRPLKSSMSCCSRLIT